MTACNEAEQLADARLTLQVKRSGERHYRPMPMSVVELIRRWLHHVLPCGLHRVRRYGFFHPGSKWDIEEVRLMIAAALGRYHVLLCSEQIVMAESPAMQCPQCGNAMISLGYTPPPEIILTGNVWPASDMTFPARAPP